MWAVLIVILVNANSVRRIVALQRIRVYEPFFGATKRDGSLWPRCSNPARVVARVRMPVYVARVYTHVRACVCVRACGGRASRVLSEN